MNRSILFSQKFMQLKTKLYCWIRDKVYHLPEGNRLPTSLLFFKGILCGQFRYFLYHILIWNRHDKEPYSKHTIVEDFATSRVFVYGKWYSSDALQMILRNHEKYERFVPSFLLLKKTCQIIEEDLNKHA